MEEIHLIIIWSKASHKKEDIIDDVSSKFSIIEKIDVTWNKDNFSDNLSRFYGESLPKNSKKEKHCGNDTFTCLVIKDSNPNYDFRKTSKGGRVVNTNLFDSKQLYRKWTGGGHKIHATDDVNETKLQLALLFSKDYAHYLNLPYKYKESTFNKDLVGCSGWDSFEELFNVLNITSNYVVLRNFDNLDEQLTSDHPDVDLLVESKNSIATIMNAIATTNKRYKVQYCTMVGGKSINFDLRHVGDNYYCESWQIDLLNTREKVGYIYTPSRNMHYYSLMYHALLHKDNLALDYIKKLIDLSKEIKGLNDNLSMNDSIDINLLTILLNYMHSNRYSIVEPLDISVFFNTSLLSKKYSVDLSQRRRFYSKYLYLRQFLGTYFRLVKSKINKTRNSL